MELSSEPAILAMSGEVLRASRDKFWCHLTRWVAIIPPVCAANIPLHYIAIIPPADHAIIPHEMKIINDFFPAERPEGLVLSDIFFVYHYVTFRLMAG